MYMFTVNHQVKLVKTSFTRHNFQLESNLAGIIKTFNHNQSLLHNDESAKHTNLKSWYSMSGYVDEKAILINKIFQS